VQYVIRLMKLERSKVKVTPQAHYYLRDVVTQ